MASVIISPKFERQLKRLAKKFHSLKVEFPEFVESLKSNPIQGIHLGRNCYKIRFSIASKGRGKSGGGRVITCFQVVEDTVFLLAIYDKSEQETLSETELTELLDELGLNLD